MNYLPSELLTDYAHQFYGFGTWNAKVWFVGIEETGGENLDEIHSRLRVWDERGKKPLENAPIFYPASGVKNWHGTDATIQPTWKQLIRMLLLARGERDTAGAILDYQRAEWGSTGSQTCVVDLLPLPSPTPADWTYHNWSPLGWLSDRTLYLKELKTKRMTHLKERVAEQRPKVVIFHGTTLPSGTSLLPIWIQIAGRGRFQQAIEGKRILLVQQTEHTLFFVTRDPASETDAYFREIGRFLRDEFGKSF